MSVYPQITLSENSDSIKPLTPFYFQSKSGTITEVRATGKQEAKTYYLTTVMPAMTLPPPMTCCVFFESVRVCQGPHCKELMHSANQGLFDTEDYARFFHQVGSEFFTSGRFQTMYHEIPSCTATNHAGILVEPSGRIVRWNPRCFVYSWKNANVEFCSRQACRYPFHQAMMAMSKMDSLRVCYEKVYYHTPSFTHDQWDRLDGSLEPLAEPPQICETEMEEDEVRKPVQVRKRHTYHLISLEDTGT